MLTKQRHCRCAFTLVELLVILAVVGALLWLLLPVLSKAREKRNRIGCASNLRQIGTAMLAYASDHDGHFPTAADNNANGATAYWYTTLIANHYASYGMFRCPTDVVPRNAGGIPRSYAVRIDDNLRSYNPAGVFWIQGSRTNCPVLNPPDVIIVGEKVDPLTTMDLNSAYDGIKSPTASHVTARPHSVHVPGAPFEGNYLFMDGHVAWIETVQDRNWPNCPSTYSPISQPCP